MLIHWGVVYSPIRELFDPGIWEYWAMLLAMVGIGLFGHWAAQMEDRDRLHRRQARAPGSRRRSSTQSAAPTLHPDPAFHRAPFRSDPPRPRQRAISYDVRPGSRSELLPPGLPRPHSPRSNSPRSNPPNPPRPDSPRPDPFQPR